MLFKKTTSSYIWILKAHFNCHKALKRRCQALTFMIVMIRFCLVRYFIPCVRKEAGQVIFLQRTHDLYDVGSIPANYIISIIHKQVCKLTCFQRFWNFTWMQTIYRRFGCLSFRRRSIPASPSPWQAKSRHCRHPLRCKLLQKYSLLLEKDFPIA